MHILRIFIVCLGVTSYISCASDDEQGMAVLTSDMLQSLRMQLAPVGVRVTQMLTDANIYTVVQGPKRYTYECVVGEAIEGPGSSLMNGNKIPHENNLAYQAFLQCYRAAKAQQQNSDAVLRVEQKH